MFNQWYDKSGFSFKVVPIYVFNTKKMRCIKCNRTGFLREGFKIKYTIRYTKKEKKYFKKHGMPLEKPKEEKFICGGCIRIYDLFDDLHNHRLNPSWSRNHNYD